MRIRTVKQELITTWSMLLKHCTLMFTGLHIIVRFTILASPPRHSWRARLVSP